MGPRGYCLDDLRFDAYQIGYGHQNTGIGTGFHDGLGDGGLDNKILRGMVRDQFAKLFACKVRSLVDDTYKFKTVAFAEPLEELQAEWS
jgi:hypothetical protein